MSGEFAQLVVDEAIFHQVPQRRRSSTTPEELQLSEAVCQLTDDVRTKIQANFRKVLTSYSREVVEEVEVKKSALPDCVHEYLTKQRDLVDVSADIAQLLWDSQKASSPAGLLLVAAASLAGQRALLIVKLEQEGGLRAQDVVVGGRRTFDMRYFADLLMTEHNKVYKAALFSVDGITEEGHIEGWAADKQLGGKMAQFWLQAFLGCRQKKDPKLLTQGFHEAAGEWIDQRVNDPEKRLRYLMALLVELRSNTSTLDPTAFARRNLDLRDQDGFLTYLTSKNVETSVFDKDVARVATRLSELRLGFESGIFIVAPVKRVYEDIEIDDHPDGTSTVTVQGKITSTLSYYSARKQDTQPASDQTPQADPNG
ncbi:nucleoid-associated protein [Streptomyces sp. NPDC001982]|uniref:nucleoid-associated protein n=1 Tax=Streptomyces sp. NPDC001982 TaxID=3154405 RepID=UPI00332EAC97